jgi:hypothetical protein
MADEAEKAVAEEQQHQLDLFQRGRSLDRHVMESLADILNNGKNDNAKIKAAELWMRYSPNFISREEGDGKDQGKLAGFQLNMNFPQLGGPSERDATKTDGPHERYLPTVVSSEGDE